MKLIQLIPCAAAGVALIISLSVMPAESPVRVLTALTFAGVAILLWPLPDPTRRQP